MIQARVRDYLAERRRLGFELLSAGRTLMSFARYVDAQDNPGPLTVELMAQWARGEDRQRGTPVTWARRLKRLRPFARYLRQFEPRTEVPDALFGSLPQRQAPHIYREQEIVDLLGAARGLALLTYLGDLCRDIGEGSRAISHYQDAIQLADAIRAKLSGRIARQSQYGSARKSASIPLARNSVPRVRKRNLSGNNHEGYRKQPGKPGRYGLGWQAGARSLPGRCVGVVDDSGTTTSDNVPRAWYGLS